MSNVLWRLRVSDSCPASILRWNDVKTREEFGIYYDERVTACSTSAKASSPELQKHPRLYESFKFPLEGTTCQNENKYLGWVYEPSRVGDKICIFEGNLAPLILRERPDGLYEVIGDTYIHGIMKGETMEVPGFEWKEIGLR